MTVTCDSGIKESPSLFSFAAHGIFIGERDWALDPIWFLNPFLVVPLWVGLGEFQICLVSYTLSQSLFRPPPPISFFFAIIFWRIPLIIWILVHIMGLLMRLINIHPIPRLILI